MSAALSERELRAVDGTRLFFRRWQPIAGGARAELLVVHGYAEHGGRYRELAFQLAAQGIATSAVDLRGHGAAAGRRGHVRGFRDYHHDVEAALAAVPAAAPRFVLGHSHGGLIALDYISERKPTLRGLILTNPYLALAMPVPKVKVVAGKALARVVPWLALPSGIPPEGVSRDPAIVDAYRRDPLIFKTATTGWFVESLAAQARVRALTRLELPLYYLYSDADPIASPAANQALAESLTSPDKTVEVRQGELHEILNELDRAATHQRIGAWILAHAPA